jgi:hypothetical protein
MIITGVGISTLIVPLSGLLADRGMPLLWSTAGLAAVCTGLVFGAQAVYATGSLAASWVMQVRACAA